MSAPLWANRSSYFLVALIPLMLIWVIYADIGDRLDDARLARDVARQIADGERALLGSEWSAMAPRPKSSW